MKIKFGETMVDMKINAPDTFYTKDMDAWKGCIGHGIFTKEFNPDSIMKTMKVVTDKLRFAVRDNFAGVIKSSKLKIGVHDGIMHADDVLGVAFICIFVDHLFGDKGNFGKHVKITRSRDTKKLDKCDIVLDVGGSDFIDSEDGRIQFDHHQDNLAYPDELVDLEAYPDGVQFAACGKIYDLLFGARNSEEYNKYVYQNLLHPIEAQDNGCKITMSAHQNLLSFVKEIGNPSSVEPEDMDDVFKNLVLMTIPIANSVFANAEVAEHNEKAFVEAVNENESGDPRILILNESFAWKSVLFKKLEQFPHLNQTLFVVFPHFEGDRWNLQAVNTTPTGFELRMPLPEAWRGKNAEDLAAVSGIPGAIFCHKNGFIAAWETKGQAIEAAISALVE